MQPSNQINPGSLIHGRYLVERMVGRGGMGAVYEAVDQRLGNKVALKQMLVSGPGTTAAFEREARILAGLRHPALPRVIDYFGETLGQFLVMEFIPGTDLGKMLGTSGQPLPLHEVLDWGDQALAALEYLHSQTPPIIHRDIKPQNITLTPKGEIVILDFGLAKGLVEGQNQAQSSVLAYTPAYAPIEQIQGTGTSPASDIYSLAATLYHLFTGTRPPDVLHRLGARASGQAEPLQPANSLNPLIAPALAQWLNQGMAIEANQRYASAGAMRAALKQLQQAGSAPRSSTSPAQGQPPTPATLVLPVPGAANVQPQSQGPPPYQSQPPLAPPPPYQSQPPPPPHQSQPPPPAWQSAPAAQARPLWHLILGAVVVGFVFLFVMLGVGAWLFNQREPGGGVAAVPTATSTPSGAVAPTVPPTVVAATPADGFVPVQPPDSIIPTTPPTPSGSPPATSTPSAQTGPNFGPLAWQVPVFITASDYAPSGVDAAGNITSFEPQNAVDGQTDTAWRVAGDGIDEYLLLEFDPPIKVHEVQIIPGYAKIDPYDGTDRFYQNRRVRYGWIILTEDDWFPFEFEDAPTYQAVVIPEPIVTDFVVILIDETYPHPSGPAGRDFTPISEVAVWGQALRP
ncbi:serine/threonine protein kinase [Candidatus Viridilinea mediisalina]|uniref:Protein kinase domain-containing protein n=1 Tax=Candidatus Viridilinea mediisalina TaxID=2024553 RepID=A0A2A6RGP9_9CHLR|nr:serine/threonine-protein kinase [Candidatus Viridilinea mediisalina]PDW02304.1 hypothetical protein CJ255_14675 [Candidatus Viridilinea mediisalina]